MTAIGVHCVSGGGAFVTRRRVVARVAVAAVTVSFGVAGYFAIAEVARMVGAMASGIGEVAGVVAEGRRQVTTTPEENHEFQRKTAHKFRIKWPTAETLRFTQEGGYLGSGQWVASAVVTVQGLEYDESVGPGTTFGEALPNGDSTPSPESLTVFYSNGTSEVIQ